MIGNTENAKAMTHVFVCLNMALSCEAQCFPIFSQSSSVIYEGCAVLGFNFRVCLDGMVYDPVDHQSLRMSIANSISHVTTLQKIYQIVGWDTKTGIFPTMRMLNSELMKVKLSDEQRDLVKAQSKFLRYDQNFWEQTTTNILRVFKILIDHTHDISSEIPMHYTALFSTDRVVQILSAFGATGPCFNIPSGKQFKLQAGVKNCPVPFAIQSIQQEYCVQQWHKIIKDGYITNKPQNFSAKQRFKMIEKAENREQVWMGLVELYNHDCPKQVADKVVAAEPTGKWEWI